jgi:hypothetical protein
LRKAFYKRNDARPKWPLSQAWLIYTGFGIIRFAHDRLGGGFAQKK